jgi:hypothetical protein
MLLAMSFVAIAIGACLYNLQLASGIYFLKFPRMLEWMSNFVPFWLPIPFAAYAAGKRRLNWPLIGTFAVCEAASVAWVAYLFSRPQPPHIM